MSLSGGNMLTRSLPTAPHTARRNRMPGVSAGSADIEPIAAPWSRPLRGTLRQLQRDLRFDRRDDVVDAVALSHQRGAPDARASIDGADTMERQRMSMPRKRSRPPLGPSPHRPPSVDEALGAALRK